jgi:hypothetical protein
MCQYATTCNKSVCRTVILVLRGNTSNSRVLIDFLTDEENALFRYAPPMHTSGLVDIAASTKLHRLPVHEPAAAIDMQFLPLHGVQACSCISHGGGV